MKMRNKLNDGNHNIALGTAIIIIVLIILFGGVFYWMWSMDMLFLPSFVEDLLGIGDRNESSWDLGELSNLVKDGKDENGRVVTFEVTYENLRGALLSKAPENGVAIVSKITYYNTDTASSRNVAYYRDGSRFRIEQYKIGAGDKMDESTLEVLKISNGDELYVLDCVSGKSNVIAQDIRISPENEAGIPSVEDLLSVVDRFPSTENGIASEEANITDTQLTLVRTEDGNVYYIAFTYADIGIREEYYVSLEHRTVISCNTTQNGKPVYSYENISFSNLPVDYSQDSLYLFSKSDDQ